MLSRLLALPLALSLAACAAQPGLVAPLPVVQPTWAFEASDLPVDPAFRFGTLLNGMRYIIRRNATPAGTALVRLEVEAGSLDERDDERGFAHFVEHMAFNGTTNVPEGEMVRLLERSGLAFGADTNAQTSFEQTLYMLDLPRAEPELLDTALMLMRETASEIRFNPEAVNRERGVVLAERRDGLSYQLRNFEDQIAFLYPQARYIERLPIGTEAALKGATAEALRAFYQREYTPADATLIVTGDFDSALVEAEIAEHFAGWGAAPPAPRPADGRVDPRRGGETDVFIDPALSERVTVSRHGPWLDEPDTAASRRTNLLRQVGYGIVNRRFQRLSRQVDAPFRAAGFGTSEVFEIGRTTNLIVDTVDGGWRAGLDAATEEYRRALAQGFSAAEVAEQVANIRTASQNAAAGADTRSNGALVAAALALVRDEKIPTTPQSSLERFEAFIPQITPAAVLAALQAEAVPLKDPLIRFQGRTPPTGGAEAIRGAWEAAAQRKLAAAGALAGGEFAYTAFGTPGAVVSDQLEPQLDIREVVFANGVRLNLKRTELERDRVRVRLSLDGGELLDTRDDPHATEMMAMFTAGGLGQHSQDELQSLLAGRSVGGSLTPQGDVFVADAVTTPRDLELQLQLLAAYLTDPGYRPEGEQLYRQNIANFFARHRATPGAALSSAIGGILSDQDPRFTLGAPADYQALSFDRLRAAIGDRLASGAIGIGIVGDIDEEQAIALVARTFGALPAREPEFRAYDAERQRTFTERREPVIVRHTGEADQAVIRSTWKTRDDDDPRESLALGLLERVARIELTDELREALGKAYSPSASSSPSRVFDGYGTFSIHASVDVHEVPETTAALDRVIAGLRSAPVAADLLQRARAPMIEALDNALKTNAGWIALVDRAQSEPERIARYRDARATLLALSARDLQAVARRYLTPEGAVRIVVLPEGAAVPE